MVDYKTIIETKDTKFFENIFLLNFEKIYHAQYSLKNVFENIHEDLRSKTPRNETSFENDFYTYLIDNDSLTYFETLSSPHKLFSKKAIKDEIDSILQNKTWELVVTSWS